MFLLYYNLHILSVISWMVFLLQLIKSIECNKTADKIIFSFLSLFFMGILTFLGVKLILLNPSVEKSANWLHLKLSIVLALMFENIFLIYVAFKKSLKEKILEIIYWLNYILFVIILFLSLFQPF